MDLFTKAKELGIQTEFVDGQGHRHVTDIKALKIIVDALPARTPRRLLETPRRCIMNIVLHPWQLLAAILAGWVNREQQQRIEYQRTEIQVLKENLGCVLQFARENPTWGYDRIADALANIGHQLSDQTVGNVLKGHGIEPAPERQRTTTWSTFLKAH